MIESINQKELASAKIDPRYKGKTFYAVGTTIAGKDKYFKLSDQGKKLSIVDDGSEATIFVDKQKAKEFADQLRKINKDIPLFIFHGIAVL